MVLRVTSGPMQQFASHHGLQPTQLACPLDVTGHQPISTKGQAHGSASGPVEGVRSRISGALTFNSSSRLDEGAADVAGAVGSSGKSSDPRIPETDFRLFRFAEGELFKTPFPYVGAGEMR